VSAALVGPQLRPALLEHGLLVETVVPGVYQRGAVFEQVVRGIEGLVHRTGQDLGLYEPLQYFSALMPREVLEKTGYLSSFPDLIGSVHTFAGSDADHAALLATAERGGDWSEALSPSEVTLCSAACHPLYPQLTGDLPEGGRHLEVQGFCFRHEPSTDPVRMQSFRQHEFVHVGTPESALAHRDGWLERAHGLLTDLGLPVEKVVANDPFFGRAGRMLARNQREAVLKYELVCPVSSEEKPTAIASTNYHLDHFGEPFSIHTTDGEPAHSACIGFGLERITLALLATHGLDPAAWPEGTRGSLAL
jgi:seryl-tRNA synthetase